jgi:hypothetical protein
LGVEQRGHIEGKIDRCIGREIKIPFKSQRGAIRAAGEVVGEAGGRSVFGAKSAFESQEDISTLPAPVQAIQIRIEGMIRRILRGGSGIRFLIETEVKAQRFVLASGDVFERAAQPSLRGIHPREVRRFELGSIRLLQGEAAEEEAAPADGKDLTGGGLALGIEQQRRITCHGCDGEVEDSGVSRRAERGEQKEAQEHGGLKSGN